jgi:hypothetical protein
LTEENNNYRQRETIAAIVFESSSSMLGGWAISAF